MPVCFILPGNFKKSYDVVAHAYTVWSIRRMRKNCKAGSQTFYGKKEDIV